MHVIAAKAVSFKEALQPDFKAYTQQIVSNASKLAETLLETGARLVSGGTDNHLVLLDVRAWGLTGKEAEHLLEAAGITVNKNTIPYDPESPFVTSGIRIGTAAVTTRGMKEKDMELIGRAIADILKSKGDPAVTKRVQETIQQLCREYPLYQELLVR